MLDRFAYGITGLFQLMFAVVFFIAVLTGSPVWPWGLFVLSSGLLVVVSARKVFTRA